MRKMGFILLFTFFGLKSYAGSPCEIRPGTTMGIKVVEFATGNTVHSKMLLSEASANALYEEITSLQDMGICEEKTPRDKCVLKYEKTSGIQKRKLSLYRGKYKWNSWKPVHRTNALRYVKSLKLAGFCS